MNAFILLVIWGSLQALVMGLEDQAPQSSFEMVLEELNDGVKKLSNFEYHVFLNSAMVESDECEEIDQKLAESRRRLTKVAQQQLAVRRLAAHAREVKRAMEDAKLKADSPQLPLSIAMEPILKRMAKISKDIRVYLPPSENEGSIQRLQRHFSELMNHYSVKLLSLANTFMDWEIESTLESMTKLTTGLQSSHSLITNAKRNVEETIAKLFKASKRCKQRSMRQGPPPSGGAPEGNGTTAAAATSTANTTNSTPEEDEFQAFLKSKEPKGPGDTIPDVVEYVPRRWEEQDIPEEHRVANGSVGPASMEEYDQRKAGNVDSEYNETDEDPNEEKGPQFDSVHLNLDGDPVPPEGNGDPDKYFERQNSTSQPRVLTPEELEHAKKEFYKNKKRPRRQGALIPEAEAG